MKSSNAPFNEFGFSMVLRDIEDLYISVSGIGDQLAALTGVVNGLSQAFGGLTLGTMAFQNANAVAITGGTLDGITSITSGFGHAGSIDYELDSQNYIKFPAQGTSLGAELSGGNVATGTTSKLKLYGTGVDLSASGGSSLTNLDGGTITLTYGASRIRVATFQDFAISFVDPLTVPSVATFTGGTGSLTGASLSLASGFATLTTTAVSVNNGTTVLNATALSIGSQQVVTGRQSAVTAPTGGTTIDTQARTAISAIISRMQTHGLIS